MDIEKKLEYEKKLKAYEDKKYYTLGEAAKEWVKESKNTESDALELLCSIIARDGENIRNDHSYALTADDYIAGKVNPFKRPDYSRLIKIEKNINPKNIKIHRDHLRTILDRQEAGIPNFLHPPEPPDNEQPLQDSLIKEPKKNDGKFQKFRDMKKLT